MLMDWEYQRESYADAESYLVNSKARKQQMNELQIYGGTINEY